MKRALLLAVFLLVMPGLVSAQIGAVCLFADQSGTDCTLTDGVPGLLSVYVIHTFVAGATAIQFSAPKPPCMVGATWLDDTWPFTVTIGDSQSDVAVGYGGCQSGSIHVLTINYAVSGTTTADCAYSVLPAVGQIDILTVDCDNMLNTGTSGTTFINSNLPCECDGVLPDPPVLAVAPLSLDFGLTDTLRTLQVSNVGGGVLNWQIFSSAPAWLFVSPISGSGAGTLTVTVDRSGVEAGPQQGVISVASNGGVINVPVTMSVMQQPPALAVNPTLLNFGETTTNLNFGISNTGGPTLSWNVANTAPWLTALPPSGVQNANIGVTVDRTGLTPGPYNDVIHVTSNAGNADVTVTMTVPTPVPILGFSPSSLNFPMGTDSLPLNISNTGQLDLLWNIAGNQPWLSVNPAAGTNDTQVFVRVDRTGLPDGPFNGTLSITSNGGNGSVPVTMTVSTIPVLLVSPTQLNFSNGITQRLFNIQNVGAGTLQWSVSANRTWIQIVPPQAGTGPATVTVNVNPNSVPTPGQQFGNILVVSNGGNATVNVKFTPPAPPGIAGVLGLYSDPNGFGCDIIDNAPGLLPVYVVHQNTPGATAVQFSAPMPACWTGAIFLSDTPVFAIAIGNSQTGIALGYGACLASPIQVLTINYFVQGLGSACCRYDLLPDPNVLSGQIDVVDCAQNLLSGFGSPAFINPDGTCGCGSLPVEETTWGQVKAMYHGPGTFRPQKK